MTVRKNAVAMNKRPPFPAVFAAGGKIIHDRSSQGCFYKDAAAKGGHGDIPSQAPVPALRQDNEEERGSSVSAEALPCRFGCVTQPVNMRVTAKQRGCDRSGSCGWTAYPHGPMNQAISGGILRYVRNCRIRGPAGSGSHPVGRSAPSGVPGLRLGGASPCAAMGSCG